MDPILWAILLVVIGVALIVMEVFVPSGGLLSFFAFVCLAAAIWVGYSQSAMAGTSILLVVLVLVPVVVISALKIWPHTPIGRRIIGRAPASPDDVLPDTEAYTSLKQLIGTVGQAKSAMLPSGAVELADRTYDAVSDGVPIEPGQRIKVVAIRNNRLIVRPTDQQPTESALPTTDDILSQPIDSLGIDPFEDPLA